MARLGLPTNASGFTATEGASVNTPQLSTTIRFLSSEEDKRIPDQIH